MHNPLSVLFLGKAETVVSNELLLIPQSKVKVMMVAITTPCKSENEFLRALNGFDYSTKPWIPVVDGVRRTAVRARVTLLLSGAPVFSLSSDCSLLELLCI